MRERSRQRFASLSDIAPVKEPGAQHDLFRHRFVMEYFQGSVDCFRTAGRIAKGGVKYSLLDVGHAFLGQRVDADEGDISASGGLRGKIGAMRAGIVMGIHKVDVIEAGEGRFHFLAGFWFEPFHIRNTDIVDAGARNAFAKTDVTVLAWRRAHQTLQLDDLAVAAKFLDNPLAGRFANLLVVSADEASVFVAEHAAIENDDRDARLHGARDRLRQRLRFLGADDEKIDLGADEFIDVRPLFKRVVLGVLENNFEFRMLGGGGADVLVHLHAPRLAEVALRHADGELVRAARFGIVAAGQQSESKDGKNPDE